MIGFLLASLDYNRSDAHFTNEQLSRHHAVFVSWMTLKVLPVPEVPAVVEQHQLVFGPPLHYYVIKLMMHSNEEEPKNRKTENYGVLFSHLI